MCREALLACLLDEPEWDTVLIAAEKGVVNHPNFVHAEFEL